MSDNHHKDCNHYSSKTSILPPSKKMRSVGATKTCSDYELKTKVHKLQTEVEELKVRIDGRRSVGCQGAGQQNRGMQYSRKPKKDKHKFDDKQEDGNVQYSYRSFSNSKEKENGGYRKNRRAGRWVRSRNLANQGSQYNAQQNGKSQAHQDRRAYGRQDDRKHFENITQPKTRPYVSKDPWKNHAKSTHQDVRTHGRKNSWENTRKITRQYTQQWPKWNSHQSGFKKTEYFTRQNLQESAHPYSRNSSHQSAANNRLRYAEGNSQQNGHSGEVHEFADLRDKLERKNALQICHRRMVNSILNYVITDLPQDLLVSRNIILVEHEIPE
ncbi:hypothetical protein QAD02_003559 [Eretmocerus hayati]|uniref:Uncharacterized protein n=1 Tax=Eretmocerus hayati TaxID=131215 RepID=A0ACC2NRZ0_9HYME|nr:hypothetical protein QAD02_003559 [Eretmocerus hayati]